MSATAPELLLTEARLARPPSELFLRLSQALARLRFSDAVEQSDVDEALRLLRTAGVVAGRREGRNVFYRLSDAHVRMLLDVTREHALHQADGAGVLG